MVNVHHIKAHFLRKQRIVLGNFLHFADKRTRQRLHLKSIVFFIFKILHRRNYRRRRMKRLSYAETLYRRNKHIYSAVRKIDFLYNSCGSSDFVQIGCGRRISLVIQHNNSNISVGIISLFNNFCIFRRRNHKRRKNPRKNRASLKRNNRKFRRKHFVGRNNLAFFFRLSLFPS